MPVYPIALGIAFLFLVGLFVAGVILWLFIRFMIHASGRGNVG